MSKKLDRVIERLKKHKGRFEIDPVSCFEVQVNFHDIEDGEDYRMVIEDEDITVLMKKYLELLDL